MADNDLSQQLENLKAALEKFQALLAKELSALQKLDLDTLAVCLNDKVAIADQASFRFEQLQADLKASTSFNQIDEWLELESLAPHHQQLEQIKQLTINCQQANERNGLTIQALINNNTQLANLIFQREPTSAYTATGTKTSASHNATLGKA